MVAYYCFSRLTSYFVLRDYCALRVASYFLRIASRFLLITCLLLLLASYVLLLAAYFLRIPYYNLLLTSYVLLITYCVLRLASCALLTESCFLLHFLVFGDDDGVSNDEIRGVGGGFLGGQEAPYLPVRHVLSAPPGRAVRH